MHDSGPEGHPLLPATREAGGKSSFLAFKPRELQNPVLLRLNLFPGQAINTPEEIQIFADRQVVVEREFL